MTETGTRNPGPTSHRRRPRRHPGPPVSAKALAAAKTFHAPLAGRGDKNLSRPGQTLELGELDDDEPELTL